MIVTCGEAMIDLVPSPTAEDPAASHPVLGGSLPNVALAIARLGGRAGYLWELSRDRYGDLLRQALAEAGVDLSCVAESTRATPVASVDFSGPEPHYAIADPDGQMRHFDPGTFADHAVLGAAELLHTGSAALALEPSGSAIERFVASLPERPGLSLDINARPPSIADPAAYRARLERLIARATLVQASVADLEIAFPDLTPARFLERCLAAGTGLAIVTRGAAGVIAATPTVRLTVPAKRLTVVDPVGAGDAFAAGLLTALQRAALTSRSALRSADEPDLAAALDFAQRVAATVCTRTGAAMPWLTELVP